MMNANKYGSLILVFAGCLFPNLAYSSESECRSYYEQYRFERARAFCGPLAKSGNAIGQNYFGMMYSRGQGVPMSYQEATKWYQLSAQQGNADAAYNLGEIMSTFQIGPRNFKEAAKWYRQAADHGNVDAAVQLGILHSGCCLPKDYKEALKWNRFAANRGSSAGQYNLGQMYRNGNGVSQNLIIAYALLSLAGEKMDQDSLNEDLTSNQIAIAKSISSELSNSKNFLGTLDKYEKQYEPRCFLTPLPKEFGNLLFKMECTYSQTWQPL